MYYFFDKKDQVNTILVDNTGRHENMMLPVFYSGKTINTITLMDENPNDTSNYDSLNVYSYIRPAQSMKIFSGKNGIDMPQFVIFVVDKDLEKRVEHMKQYFPLLKHMYDVPPSLLDKIMKKLNPVNRNEMFLIYSTGILPNNTILHHSQLQ
jgi:hypothetical protein